MTASRLIELSFWLLLAFVIISVASFLTIRPSLNQARFEARAEWDAFLRAVKERNDLLPGLAEAVKGFEPGHSNLTVRLLDTRSVSMRATGPDTVVASVDEMERYLGQIEGLLQARPELERYPPFANHWTKIVTLTRRIALARCTYNNSVRLYNTLLKPFPQNVLTTVFGFVPINDYPTPARYEERGASARGFPSVSRTRNRNADTSPSSVPWYKRLLTVESS